MDRPAYNILPVQNRENMAGALSFVPKGVLLTEDVTAFIHAKQEELGETYIQGEYMSLCEEGKLPGKYANLVSSGLINGVCYLAIFREDQVRLVLSRLHEPSFWLTKGACHEITKENLHRVIRYSDKGEALTLCTIANTVVNKLTKSKSNG